MSASILPSSRFPASAGSDRWTIFCAVIDNFGDMGVCWRMARQLATEHGQRVTLWIDDPAALERFLGKAIFSGRAAGQCHADFCLSAGPEVQIRHWGMPWMEATATDDDIAQSAVIIEAFGCTLPDEVQAALARQTAPPVWINLEYLSAESWVQECHGLQSLLVIPGASSLSNAALQKTFFFPGFVPGTGGLLREQGLLERHEAWQGRESESRAQLLAELGVVLPDNQSGGPGHASAGLLVSVFTYESASLRGWLDALSNDADPVLCLIPEGRAVDGVAEYFDLRQRPAVGTVLIRGALTVAIIPFLSQDRYDNLLSLCDFNLVRGEDSFVRAQWAARPLLWHIYPQEQDAHLVKLEAFLDLYCPEPADEATGLLRQFWRFWNQGEDCRELWHHLRPQLPGLRQRARKWQQKLAEMPDLASNLVQFYRNQL